VVVQLPSRRPTPVPRARPRAHVLRHLLLCALANWPGGSAARGHGPSGQETITWSATAPRAARAGEPTLRLTVLDAATGGPTAARFTVQLGGRSHLPAALGPDGLRFTAIHQRRDQRFTATYVLGDGPVEVPLAPGTRAGRVTVTKGYEYVPVTEAFTVDDGEARVAVRLRRWADSRVEGWVSADEHVHFDRTDPAHDADWLALLAGDDLHIGHFLLARGTNVRGLWGIQYAYGREGEAVGGGRSIRSGEEYRDGAQGHVNLLGLESVIWPISAGGLRGAAIWSYPPLRDVLRATGRQGGLGGVAHGGAYGRRSTAALDAVLGAADFFEIANTHLYEPELWYRLMNCGWWLPPAAGTDLPNFPYRDPWQPLLGETRMYARTGGRVDFASWKAAVKRGEVWITSGPQIRISVDGAEPGDTIRLPATGGSVTVTAELAGLRPLTALELVRDGAVVGQVTEESVDGPIHRLWLRRGLRFEESGWIAARGRGGLKAALARSGRVRLPALAHTGAVRVLVGDRPIRSPADAALLAARLEADRDFYRRRGRFQRQEHRARFLKGFDRGLAILHRRAARDARSPAPESGARSRRWLPVAACSAFAAFGLLWRARRRWRTRPRSVP